ncbi:enoyl-CoA hydratase-related protein [Sphingopyxis sp.]|uniref:enoyl-CoA hydratase/isomerase family protein n=1 Tax=Sphingopyxis sp. TaxID=1908224 RepID=UPI002608C3E7|nr:enoyl-CoA hydratase-related protein [Sphingopyxis sp.]MCW0200086.1 enoyl-CoA hydratase-related protein [Sphingopyxis sp.]
MSLATLETRGPVATITINRPGHHNALDLETAQALEAAAREVAADAQISVVLLRGAGRAFCGGGDIFAFAEHMDDLEAYVRELLAVQHRFILRIARMPKIAIAAVHGSAAGAGLSLAAMCDMCVAEEDVRFVPAFASLGLSPDSGATFGLARAVGTRRALRLFLAERSFSAIEAEAWGLVTKLADRGQAVAEAERLADRIAATGPDAIANTKRLLGRLDTGILEEQLHNELESIVRCMKTESFRSAVRSFTEKKPS